MNVSELSQSLYSKAGVDAAALRRLNSTRRSDRPAALGEDHADGPKFSDVLAKLAVKHAPASLIQNTENLSGREVSAAEEQSDTKNSVSLSDKQIGSILKNALNSGELSSDLVNALTDDPDLLDQIFSLSPEDDDNEYLSDMLGGEDNNASLNRMLTDINTAREYLSSRSGRDLMVAMAQRSISGLVE